MISKTKVCPITRIFIRIINPTVITRHNQSIHPLMIKDTGAHSRLPRIRYALRDVDAAQLAGSRVRRSRTAPVLAGEVRSGSSLDIAASDGLGWDCRRGGCRCGYGASCSVRRRVAANSMLRAGSSRDVRLSRYFWSICCAWGCDSQKEDECVWTKHVGLEVGIRWNEMLFWKLSSRWCRQILVPTRFYMSIVFKVKILKRGWIGVVYALTPHSGSAWDQPDWSGMKPPAQHIVNCRCDYFLLYSWQMYTTLHRKGWGKYSQRLGIVLFSQPGFGLYEMLYASHLEIDMYLACSRISPPFQHDSWGISSTYYNLEKCVT